MQYFVSRQNYWGEEEEDASIVEVAAGGLDYANPGMLVVKFRSLGEGQEFNDPRTAARAALDICQAWKQTNTNAKVAYGSTGGMTMPFSPCTFQELTDWAEKAWEALPKCDKCGEVLGKQTYSHDLSVDEEKFCSSNCAEESYNYMIDCDKERLDSEELND